MKNLIISYLLLGHSFIVIACSPYPLQVRGGDVAKILNKSEHSTKDSPKESKHPSGKWHAATFRDLTVGESTQADMVRILGEPEWAGLAAGQKETATKQVIWNEYSSGGEFPGRLIVETDKSSGIIIGIFLSPDNLSKEEAIKHFGDDYIITKYKLDKCSEEEEEEGLPLYESTDGQFVYTEYRERGIAMFTGHTGKVQEIDYLDDKQPIGATSSRCPKPE
jgi:hypothetical protein